MSYTATDQKISCAHGLLSLHAELVHTRQFRHTCVPFWNVCDRNMDRRTNNEAEVFHCAWNNRVGVHHPNLWIYIRHLNDLQSLNQSDITARDRGGRPTRRSRRWQHLQNRLVQLKLEYDQARSQGGFEGVRANPLVA